MCVCVCACAGMVASAWRASTPRTSAAWQRRCTKSPSEGKPGSCTHIQEALLECLAAGVASAVPLCGVGIVGYRVQYRALVFQLGCSRSLGACFALCPLGLGVTLVVSSSGIIYAAAGILCGCWWHLPSQSPQPSQSHQWLAWQAAGLDMTPPQHSPFRINQPGSAASRQLGVGRPRLVVWSLTKGSEGCLLLACSR